MWYSPISPKQVSRYSPKAGWQPGGAVQFACTPVGFLMQQPAQRQHDDTNLFCNMKNPRKSTVNQVGTLTRTIKNSQQDLLDLPFISHPAADFSTPHELSSPEEESFRTFLQNRLPRHKAPQALRERIKNAIKNMPD